MARSKIVSEDEVLRWIREGKTYAWMVEEYERKYNIQVTGSAFANIRYRRGVERKIARSEALMPWEVRKEHRWEYPAQMLRVEARRREGRVLREVDAKRLASWKQTLLDNDLVVHYDPDTEEGWFYVPRRKGIDTDLIREPGGAGQQPA